MNKVWNYSNFLLLIVLFNIISYLLHLSIINEITIYYLLYLLAVFSHEVGHFIFGKMIGMELKSLYAGPLRIYKVNNNVKLKRNNIFSLSNGLCQMFKYIDKNQVSRKLSLYYLGGIFINLLLFISVIFTISIVPRFHFNKISTIFGIINFVIALATLLPFEGNDGWMAFLLLKNDKRIRSKAWLQNIYISNVDIGDLTEVEINDLMEVFNTHKDLNDIFASGSLLALHFIKKSNYGLGKEYFMKIISIMNKQNKTNRIEVKSYIEIIDFQLNLLFLLKENKDRINFKGFDENELIKKANEYYIATVDSRFREYIDIVLSRVAINK